MSAGQVCLMESGLHQTESLSDQAAGKKMPSRPVVGGLMIGILDSVVRSWLGGTWGLFSTFFVLAVILILKPNGFFGKRVEGR